VMTIFPRGLRHHRSSGRDGIPSLFMELKGGWVVGVHGDGLRGVHQWLIPFKIVMPCRVGRSLRLLLGVGEP